MKLHVQSPGLGAQAPRCRHSRTCCSKKGKGNAQMGRSEVLPTFFQFPSVLCWLQLFSQLNACRTYMSYSYTHEPCAASWLSFVFIGLHVKQAQLCFFSFFLMLMMNQFLLQEPAMATPLQCTQASLPGPSAHIRPSSAASSWSTEI